VLVVIDTNIVVSSLLFRGRASFAHRLWVEGQFDLAFSDAVLDEYRQVLGYPKFGRSGSDVEYLVSQELTPFGRTFKTRLPVGAWIPEDPDDDKFIALALAAKSDFLVSGGAHILDRRHELPCSVRSLAEFLELFELSGSFG